MVPFRSRSSPGWQRAWENLTAPLPLYKNYSRHRTMAHWLQPRSLLRCSDSIQCSIPSGMIRVSKNSSPRLTRLSEKGRQIRPSVNSRNFFAELKRRNVYKVAVAYAVVAWFLVQVATQVFPFLEIPNWVVRLVIAIVVIGFPIALVIAWAFEATPEGIRRTETVDAMPARAGQKKHAWIYIVIIFG